MFANCKPDNCWVEIGPDKTQEKKKESYSKSEPVSF